MRTLPNAEMSPRIASGAIKWYVGDIFKISIKLDLKDQDDEPVTIGSGDTLTINFVDASYEVVHSFVFQGANITNNTVTLDFDSTVTAKFPKGQYTYDVYLELTDSGVTTRTTLANDNKAVVE